jgi:hypothetical protein
MAKHVLLLCDLSDGACSGDVLSLKLWLEHQPRAMSLDVCEHHADPIVQIFSQGDTEALPARPRQRMEPTKLKTTKDTRKLKRQK